MNFLLYSVATNAGGGNGTLERNAYNSVLNTGD